ncbi:hypothetical protein BDV95DRAFT_589705 [Massariosphaeria phaeospora]|uniref:SMP-30/Gluconolactonase/LRE-like region domain-containing protein n=1 Tax=Massariosphaeria phaeospora TaxID=100035 RepID=A0A7C8ILA1_9PLEO|nr:hypothetical protein BDV95DRAFT_589705 [Massariosphaeria phaeospora]
MHLLNSLTLLQVLLASTATAITLSPLRTIHQFPNPTFLENIVTTRNGTLLTGILGSSSNGGALHLIDPFAAPSNASTLLYTFPDANSVLGISELEPDIYAVATGTYNVSTGPTQGSSTIWVLDLNSLCAEGTPTVRKVADLKNALSLNGIAVLNKDTFLAADSFGGTIISVDVQSGAYEVVHNDVTLAPNMSAALPIGVDGMKYVAPNLYYTNTQIGLFRVRVDPTTGAATSPYVKLASVESPDEIAVLEDGTIFMARPLEGVVERVGQDGKRTVIANKDIEGVTAVTLGRTWRDRNVFYASTFGGFAEDGAGFREGGKVVAFEIREPILATVNVYEECIGTALSRDDGLLLPCLDFSILPPSSSLENLH